MTLPLKRLKTATLRACRAAGVFSLVRDSGWRRDRLLIVCYHGVSLDDEHEWAPALYISPAAFEARMRLLRTGGYAVLPLHDALYRLSQGTLPARSVALTFDDGSADFALRAHPLLEQFAFPATVYLTTYYCGHPKPVFGVFCSYLLWKARGRSVSARTVVGTESRWDLRTTDGRNAALREIRDVAERERMSTADKDALAERLALALGIDYDALVARRILQLVRPDEVRALSAAGVRFELHTHRHRTPDDREAFQWEIVENRASIHALSSLSATHFCYPSGVHQDAWLPWLDETGVRSATTCETGIASRRTNRLLLPRMVDGEHLTPLEFESWTTGVGAFLPRRQAFRPERPA